MVLLERTELTAGSTWHAAAGFHAQNKDSNIASLQAYTIALYPEIERESGQKPQPEHGRSRGRRFLSGARLVGRFGTVR